MAGWGPWPGTRVGPAGEPTVTPPPRFSACPVAEEGGVRVEVAGEVDIDTGDELLSSVRSALDCLAGGSRPGRVVIDLSQVSFMDSSGLLAVLRCREIVERAGASMRITLPGGPVARLFEVAGVSSWLDHC